MSIIATNFNATSSEDFQGFGINSLTDFGVTLTNYINCLTLNWARLHLKSSDPGDAGLYYDDAGFDNLWLTSDDLVTGKSRFSFSALQGAQANIIFTMGAENKSFLSNNGRNELTGTRLLAYARYWASAVKIHADLGMVIEWVDLCENIEVCSGGATYITPSNYVMLCDNFKQILATRGITNVKVMGPNIQLFASGVFNNPYITAFAGTSNILDAWSLHCLENKIDLSLYNNGSFNSRKYVYDRAAPLTQWMRITLPGIPIYCTKFTTYAEKYSLGVSYGPMASEVNEFAIRLADNLCGLLSAGVSNVIFWFVYKKFDHFSLYRTNGSPRPQRDAIEMFTKNISFNGKTFYHFDYNFPTGDDTMKGLLVEGNGFTLVLSRATLTDSYLGQNSVTINNPLWTAPDYNITLSFTAFPLYVDTSGIKFTTSIVNGVLTIDFTLIPYNCIVFVKGALYPTLTALPPIQYATLNIPKVSALPTTADEGDVVFYVVDNRLYTYTNSSWIVSQLYGP